MPGLIDGRTLLTSTACIALFSGCASDGVERTYHSPNSEGGRAISSMGSAQVLYQKRVEEYQKAMVSFEKSERPIYYSSLVGPIEEINETKGIYKLQGAYQVGDYIDYHVLITFTDSSRRVVSNVEILERL